MRWLGLVLGVAALPLLGGCAGLIGLDERGELGETPAAGGSGGASGEGGSSGQGAQGGSSGNQGGSAGSQGGSSGNQGGSSGSSVGGQGGGGASGSGGSGASGASGTGGASGSGGGEGWCGGGETGQVGVSMAGGDCGTPPAPIDAKAPEFCCSLFVNGEASSSDEGPGTREAPKRTLKAALDAAAEGQTVCVCDGPYTDNLALSKKVSLIGGFDCSSWKRPPGYPFASHATVVQGAASAGVAALRIEAAGVVVDGFEWRASGGGQGASRAVAIASGSTAHFSNNRVTGGGSGAPSTGLAIEESASPEVWFNAVTGGQGMSSGEVPATAGVTIASGAKPSLVGNTIAGGSGLAMGQSAVGSVGVFVSGASMGVVLDHNDIDAGTGQSMSPTVARAGVLIEGSSGVALTHNSIRGGAGMTGGVTYGVRHDAPQAVAIEANRVYGGDGSMGGAVGVSIAQAAGGTLANNMIHGGNRVTPPGGARSQGLEIAQGSSLDVAFNTIYSGGGSAGAPAGALYVTGGSGLIVRANLLMAGPTTGAPVLLPSSSSATISSFDGNVLLTTGDDLVLKSNGASVNATTLMSVGMTMAMVYAGFPMPKPLVAIKKTCSDTQGCFALPASGCEGAGCLLRCWGSDGYDALFGAGWQLIDGQPPCVMANLPITSGAVTDDLYGVTREMPGGPSLGPTAGAAEFMGNCLQK